MKTFKNRQPKVDVLEVLNGKLPALKEILRKSAQGLSKEELELLYDTKNQFYDVLELLNMNISLAYSKAKS